VTALEIANEALNKTREGVRAYDFQQAGRLNEAHVQALSALHEGLVRSLSHVLGNCLNAAVELKLAGMEELPFLQLLTQLQPNPYVHSMEFVPQSVGGLQMDLELVFPGLDLLLGGPGKPQAVERGLSEIEVSVIEDVTRLVIAELDEVWKTLDISAVPGSYQKAAELRRMLPADERVLILRFNMKLQESVGALNIFFPIGVAAAMLRKLATMAISPARAGAPTAGQKIQERLLDCVCGMELNIRGIKVAVQDVLSLQPGKLLDLGIPISAPAVVSLEGHEWFEASPVRAGSFRAAKLSGLIKKRLTNG
jgi:flagellar motor switch protein FliM